MQNQNTNAPISAVKMCVGKCIYLEFKIILQHGLKKEAFLAFPTNSFLVISILVSAESEFFWCWSLMECDAILIYSVVMDYIENSSQIGMHKSVVLSFSG